MRRHLRLLLIVCAVALAPAFWPASAQANPWRYRRFGYGFPVYGAGFYGYRPYGFGYGYGLGFRGYGGFGWRRAYPAWGGYGFGMPGYMYGGYPAFGYGYGYGGMPMANGFYATSYALPF